MDIPWRVALGHALGGSVGLIVFGGLFGSLLVGVVWVIVEPWIPKRPVVVGAAASMIGSFALIDSENIDFTILRDPYLDILLLVGLVFTLGVVLVRVDRALVARLPDPGTSASWQWTSWSIVLLGLPVVVGLPSIFFSVDACCAEPPVLTGLLLATTAAFTLWSWLTEVRGSTPTRWQTRGGMVAAWAAVVAGAAHLAREIVQIFA